MILAQLLHGILAASLLAAGASCLVPLFRSARRPTRHLWFGTLLLAALWPLLQRGLASLRSEPADVPTLGARLLEPIVVGAAERSPGWTQIAARRAVRAALPGTIFLPAEVAGRKVRQLLEMPFTFSLSK